MQSRRQPRWQVPLPTSGRAGPGSTVAPLCTSMRVCVRASLCVFWLCASMLVHCLHVCSFMNAIKSAHCCHLRVLSTERCCTMRSTQHFGGMRCCVPAVVLCSPPWHFVCLGKAMRGRVLVCVGVGLLAAGSSRRMQCLLYSTHSLAPCNGGQCFCSVVEGVTQKGSTPQCVHHPGAHHSAPLSVCMFLCLGPCLNL